MIKPTQPLTGHLPSLGRRRASSSSAIPGQNPSSPVSVDPAFTNIITESPQSTATSHVYPPIGIPPTAYPSPYLPRTPTSASRPSGGHAIEDSLSQVDESGTEEREYPTISQSSRAALLLVKEKDYAVDEGSEGVTRRRDEDRDDDGDGKFAFADSPPRRPSPNGPSRVIPTTSPSLASPLQPIKQRTIDPSYLPRPGPADAYISRFLAPIPGPAATQPPSPEPISGSSSYLRPSAPPRAASAPGVPLASSLPKTGPPLADEEESDAHPLFKIFSAQLDVSAEEMVKRLKGHLGEVLRVQEEVGTMHLKLEGLGMGQGEGISTGLGIKTDALAKKGEGESKGDGVKEMIDKREKGVEEIMAKLGALSDSLRNYHHLGTPKMSFPPSSKPSSAYPYSSTSSPLTPAPPPLSTTSPSTASPTSASGRHPPGHPLGSPPKIHSGHGDKSRLNPLQASSTGKKGARNLSPSSPKMQQRHAPKVPSNLDQVTTADEEEDERESRSQSRDGGLLTNLHGKDDQREKDKVGDVWVERRRQDLGDETGFHASPMEMADRSRPW